MGDTRTRHRLWPRVVVFYLITMVGAGLLGLAQPYTGIDPVIIQLTQFGPALGAAVLLAWSRLPLRDLLTGGTGNGRLTTVRALALLGTPAAVMALCVETSNRRQPMS